MLTVTATIGIPRSGKSTYVQEQLKRNTALRRVNRDDIRALIAHESIHNTNPFEDEVSDIQHYLIVKHLKNGLDVIVDNTNVKAARLNDIKKSIQEFCNETKKSVLFQTKVFTTDIDECIRRNEACKSRGERYVPVDIIKAMHANLTKNLGNKSIGEFKEVITPVVPLSQNKDLPRAVICDIDGTLADISHRNPYDTAKCLDDTPITAIVELVKTLAMSDYDIIFVSGREDKYYKDTWLWLVDCGLKGELLMRKEGDTRKDSVVKYEILVNQIMPKYQVGDF